LIQKKDIYKTSSFWANFFVDIIRWLCRSTYFRHAQLTTRNSQLATRNLN